MIRPWQILTGDARTALRDLAPESVDCCVTSPPYWGLRDYGADGQIGLETTPNEYVTALVGVFAEVRRVLRADGTLWLNLGDSYATGAGSCRSPGGDHFGKANEAVEVGAFPLRQPNRMPIAGLKSKDLVGIPWMVAFALRADGWWLRSEIVWHKPNATPESVGDRPTKAHEHVFLLSKSKRYFYDQDSTREPHADPRQSKNGRTKMRGQAAVRPRGNIESLDRWYNPAGRNARSVWSIATRPFDGAHFAVMPEELAIRCVRPGSRVDGIVLDPFSGAGTVGLAAVKLSRRFIGVELNHEYVAMAERRLELEYMPKPARDIVEAEGLS